VTAVKIVQVRPGVVALKVGSEELSPAEFTYSQLEGRGWSRELLDLLDSHLPGGPNAPQEEDVKSASEVFGTGPRIW
jgi:hypothetical protein